MFKRILLIAFLLMGLCGLSAQTPKNDASMYKINLPFFAEFSSQRVTGVFKNTGTDTLKSITINWQSNQGQVHRLVKESLSIVRNQAWPFTSPDNLVLDREGKTTVKIWISSPNGKADENTSNDTLSQVIQVVREYPVKQVLLEEVTGAWCGYCPRAPIIFKKQILPAYPQVLLVAIHTGDAMAITETRDFTNNYVTGVPCGFVDRNKPKGEGLIEFSPEQWQDVLSKIDLDFTPVDLNVYNYYNPDDRSWKIDVVADFVFDIDCNYRMNCYILEDSLSGTGTSWAQRNFFNAEASDPYMELKGAGDPIPNYYHHHVVRKMLGGSWGQSGIIPASIKKGDRYVFSQSFTVPAGWKIENLHLVGIIQQWDMDKLKRPIVSAREAELSFMTGTGPVESNFSIRAYPNPFNDLISIEIKTDQAQKAEIRILNLAGQVALQTTRWLNSGENTMQMPSGTLKPGIYFVRLTTEDKTRTVRLVKQ